MDNETLNLEMFINKHLFPKNIDQKTESELCKNSYNKIFNIWYFEKQRRLVSLN